MKKLPIDFGPLQRPATLPLGLVVLVIGLALLGLVAWLAMSHAEVRAPLEAERSRLKVLAEQEQVASATAPSSARSELLEQMSMAAKKLDTPWDALLTGIEASMDENVALLGMEPQEAQGTLLLRAESRDFAAALEFVRRVEALPMLSDAHLDHHQLSAQDPQRPVQFGLAARWSAVPSVDAPVR